MFAIGDERVALVTDTACDLSEEQLREYDIRTVALRISSSQGDLRDRIEVDAETIYALMQKELPKTSLPLPEDVSRLYRELQEEGATRILHITLSSGLSGTYNMVRMLAADFAPLRIDVVDSQTLSAGLGLLVLEAAEALRLPLPSSTV